MELPPFAPDPPAAAPHTEAAALARRLDRPVVLVGMMGAGKTTLGRRLGAALGWPFIDADAEIEAAAQLSVAEIFARYGEAYFRDGERRVVARLLGADPRADAPAPMRVIATGGGAFATPETRALIRARGVAVWLDVDLETLVARTARRDTRPLLATGDPRATLARLAAERASAYAEAMVRVGIDGAATRAQTLDAIIAALSGWQAARDTPSDTEPKP